MHTLYRMHDQDLDSHLPITCSTNCVRNRLSGTCLQRHLLSHRSWLIHAAVFVIALSSITQWNSHLNAAPFDEHADFFETKVRPILANRCYSCHGADGEPGGGLRLDSKPGWQAGGESGSAIAPGSPDKSLLITAIRWTDSQLQMPPADSGGKLSLSEIESLEKWVRDGAYDPRTNSEKTKERRPWKEIYNERLNWWSLRPPAEQSIPKPVNEDWSENIDRFVFDRLTTRNVQPSELASPETLARRATLVLTGLPPSQSDVRTFLDRFANDPSTAYAEYVDKLLESPQFGERFARHWLDVVRFTETHGNEWNYDVPYAWRYRDYVIRAFNEDLPYDQFVREHVAGDLIENPRRNTKENFLESPIGTAFYRFGEVNHDSCVQFGIIGYDIVDNQIDTLTKAFQASTVACARCHDHKMDAVSAVDYHALLATLRSSRSVQRTIDDPNVNASILDQIDLVKSQLRSEVLQQWKSELANEGQSRLAGLLQRLRSDSPKDPKESKDVKDKSAAPPDEWDVSRIAVNILNASDTERVQHWTDLRTRFNSTNEENVRFNANNFEVLADFRSELPAGWITDGVGLRQGITKTADLAIARDGDKLIKAILPSGLHTFSISDRLNGALRSPTLKRGRKKVSFEVLGGRFSLARIVFNNCQFNYNHQHSIHHDKWSWITIDFPENTDQLFPYVELLTYWDNPKFPDPLGTLGKDTENQRSTFEEHSKDPSTWWGIRRIVAHDCDQPPRDEIAFLSSLFANNDCPSVDELLATINTNVSNAVVALSNGVPSDSELQWLQWALNNGLLSNSTKVTERINALVSQYRELERKLKPPTLVPTLADETPAIAQPILPRGDYTKPSSLVNAGYIAALASYAPETKSEGSGRRELAATLTHPDNPLTSRVMVNRVWQWVFGEGIVTTPDDFGHLGDLPSNQELLDYLALEFRNNGWSVKKLVRQMVLSRTFRLAGVPTASAIEIDPSNRLFSHYNTRRGEAELIRDSILKVCGRLDTTMYGPSVQPYREKADPEKRLFIGPLDGNGRRSIYIKFQLMEAPHFLSAFNIPGGKVTQGKRETSNVPSQSLALLNDPFVHEMAKNWGASIVRDESANVENRCECLLYEVLSHSPSDRQVQQLAALVRQIAKESNVPDTELMSSQLLWQTVAHTLLNLKEFIFIP